jgi:xanthine dehydrogenase accessory factor
MSFGPAAIFEQAVSLQKDGVPFVMVTVAGLEGSAPCKPGFRMIVLGDGGTHGTVGGGALEKKCVDDARQLLADGGGTLTKIVDTGKLGISKADVTLLFEPFLPADVLWIFGGGHVCQALIPMVAPLGFRIVVVDSRAEFARADRLPSAASVVHREYADAVQEIPDGAYVVIATHTHENDFNLLLEATRREPSLPYVGMIGSTKKVRRARDILRENDVTPGPNVYTPIGLDLGGGGTASEIALSIAAEMQTVRAGKESRNHCREKVPFS